MATVEEQIIDKLKCACNKLSCGILPNELSSIRNDATLLKINASENEDCEYIPVTAVDIICNNTYTITPEFKVIIGELIADDMIVYGYYYFSGTPQNPAQPVAATLEADIQLGLVSNPIRYQTDQWNPAGLDIDIVSPELCYHVIRVPDTIPIVNIKDEAGRRVNPAWSVLSNGGYNYYLLPRPISPSDVTYNLYG